MKFYIPLIAVASLTLLSACNKNDEPEVVEHFENASH